MTQLTLRRERHTAAVRALEEIGGLFTDREDPEGAVRCLALRDRLVDDHARVVLAGHFSAGKSSLVNALLQYALLPVHPLPTSANVVQVRYAERVEARAGSADGRLMDLSFGEESPWSALHEWCRDGSRADLIEVGVPAPLLADGLVIVDTPGIDSTDLRHGSITADVLFSADLVAFVVDYNHVLAKDNIAFLRRLANTGKASVVVVNQIDKHSDFELPFAHYAAQTAAALGQAGARFEGLYFISATEPDCPHNGWRDFVGDLPNLARAAHASSESVRSSAAMLVEEHLARRAADQDKEAWQRAQQWRRAVSDLEARLDGRARDDAQWIADIRARLERTVETAILFPYETTERAVRWILSLRGGQRTGLFVTRARLEKDREGKLQALVQDVRERALLHIERHLLQECRTLTRDGALLQAEAAAGFPSVQGFVTAELAQDAVSRGAHLDEAYGYRFAIELERRIKALYAHGVRALVDRAQAEWAAVREDRDGPVRRHLETLLAEQQDHAATLSRADERCADAERLHGLLDDIGMEPAIPG